MSDVKTSSESGASALDGSELIRGVQGGNNVKITGAQIKTLCVGAGSVAVASGKALTASASITVAGTDGKTVTVSDNATISGTNSGDQTITLTGDLTGSGTGSFAATIANGAVTTAKINNGAVTEAKMTLADNTTANVSTSAHGFAPKAPNDATKYLDGTGTYSYPVLRSYIAGCITSNNGGAPNTKVDVAAGLVADDTNAVMIKVAAGTVDFGTTGANGLDTGSLANSTTYHIYGIQKADGTQALLGSTSASSPTMPSGYIYKRLIWSVMTDGSAHILAYTQVGDTCYWSTVARDINNNTADLSAGVLFALTTPAGIQTRPLTRIFNNTAPNIDTLVTSPSEPNTAPSHTSAPSFDINGATILAMIYTYAKSIYTDTSSQIRIRASTSSSTTLYAFTEGFVHDRGRYA